MTHVTSVARALAGGALTPDSIRRVDTVAVATSGCEAAEPPQADGTMTRHVWMDGDWDK